MINAVIGFLNKRLGYSLSGAYYSQIKLWEDFWKGYHKPFHSFTELSSAGYVQREMFTLKMGKKICEDWAAILLNEKTQITVGDESGSELLLGDNGILSRSDFWQRCNTLIEKAFYSGTGAIVLHIENMLTENGEVMVSPDSRISMEFLSAQGIIPLSVKSGRVIDVAFCSERMVGGSRYINVETHILKSDGYHIDNYLFLLKNGQLIEQPLSGTAKTLCTGSDIPLFALISPNIVNHIDEGCGLGVSVFANAIDNLKGVDLAFNNFCRDLKLGGKKVFINQELMSYDSSGNALAPDDIAQQLFLQVGDDNLDTNELIYEFNPSLRVAEDEQSVQAQLDYLCFKCGMGTKHYRFDGEKIMTATQYTGERQSLLQSASKHYIVIERALRSIIRSMLWIGKTVMGLDIDYDCRISIGFDDSYISDSAQKREQDMKDVQSGIMQKWEYRMKWYGEDEQTAKAAMM